MEAKVFLDFSSVVWDENHFKTDETFHYKLASEVMLFMKAFESCNNLKFVARTELLQNVVKLFPYNMTNGKSELYDFRKRSLQFLSNRFGNIVTYNISEKAIRSIPNFCYEYFAESLKIEIRYLITEMHDCEDTHIFCTFRTRWDSFDKQNLGKNAANKKHPTIIHEAQKPTVEDYYLKEIRNIFEHNPKHDSNKGIYYVGKEKVNPLSCYDERNGDTTIPQKLLDIAIPHSNELYSFDTNNKTFVCFKKTKDNIYHGYNEDIKNVPQKIREEFHK
jgi:hypothetical protein